MPPATITSLTPAASMSCANIAAFMPEPHILLTVVQPVESGSPAPSAACRAGACPWPAGSTQPMITSWICSGLTPARSTAARIAAAPSCGAEKSLSSPWNAPIGARAAETMTTGSFNMTVLLAFTASVIHVEVESLLGEFDAPGAIGPLLGEDEAVALVERTRRVQPRERRQENVPVPRAAAEIQRGAHELLAEACAAAGIVDDEKPQPRGSGSA